MKHKEVFLNFRDCAKDARIPQPGGWGTFNSLVSQCFRLTVKDPDLTVGFSHSLFRCEDSTEVVL